MDVNLLKELTKSGYIPSQTRPNGYGITPREFSRANGCTISMAVATLDRAVEDGILQKHKMRIPGRSGLTVVYHRPQDWPPSVGEEKSK